MSDKNQTPPKRRTIGQWPGYAPACKRCRRCEQPTPHTYGRGLCARCYLHHGGGAA